MSNVIGREKVSGTAIVFAKNNCGDDYYEVLISANGKKLGTTKKTFSNPKQKYNIYFFNHFRCLSIFDNFYKLNIKR